MIPGLNGIIQAYSLFHQMQGQKRADEHLAMQKAELEMQKQRDADMKTARDQQQQAQDLEIRAKLLDMGTPLVGGMLEKQGIMPADSMPGMNAPMPFTYAEKPDPSKVLKYKDLAIVPHSKQDRQRMAMEQFQAEQQAKLAYEAQLAAVKRQMESIPAPSWAQEFGFQPGTMLPTSAVTALAGTRQQGLHEQFTAKENAADRASREKIAVAGQEAANARNERTNATRMAAAAAKKGAGAGPTAGQAAVQQRHEDRMLTRAEENESKAWAEVAKHEETIARLTESNTGLFSSWSEKEKAALAKAKSDAQGARIRAEAFMRQKQALMQKQNPGAAKQSTAAPSTPGKRPDPLGIL